MKRPSVPRAQVMTKIESLARKHARHPVGARNEAVVGDPKFMTSLSRGLAVLSCFAEHRRPMTLSQAAQRTGLSRASVGRCLYTLVKLGYAAQMGRDFSLRPRALTLGYAFLSSNPLSVVAQPILDQLRDRLHESCSLAVLDGDEVVYVARAEVIRVMSVVLRIGSRLPLYCTSMGRVLLASEPEQQQRAYLRRTALLQRTSRTQVKPEELLQALAKVRRQGYAIVDQELELGLRSLAVPVTRLDGLTVAAINIGTHATRVPIATLQSRYLPELHDAARELSGQIA
jgi:IclR family transcriptional regulator, pca regulon regulatory protein